MFDQLFANYGLVSVSDIILRIVLAFALGLGVSQVYRLTHRGPAFSPSFVGTLIMLPMITAVVVMVIGNSLARAFGLVGAMAIVRFRTPLKETRDIAFVFFSLAIGMAVGIGGYALALTGFALISLFLVILRRDMFVLARKRSFLLLVHVLHAEHPHDRYEGAFREFLSSWKMLDTKSAPSSRLMELSFDVRFKDASRTGEFVAALTDTDGVEKVHLLSGEDAVEM
jgi:uncharacterized membrane protein YhiD involved in acid resistance